jgi:TorA maturation chaperone TorD
MDTQNDAIAILLANRSYLYTLLQRTFGNEPSAELLAILTGPLTKEALQLLDEEDGQLMGDYLKLLDRVGQAMTDDAEETLDKLKGEYTYLLIGPNKLPAPPWESVYVTKERTIFQESTLQVRRTYLEYSFLPANYPHEADDHLALELDFMAHLARVTEENFENKNIEEVKKVLLDQQRFLQEHLLVWIGDFAQEIQKGKTQYLYPPMATLTETLLKLDNAVIEEILPLL